MVEVPSLSRSRWVVSSAIEPQLRTARTYAANRRHVIVQIGGDRSARVMPWVTAR